LLISNERRKSKLNSRPLWRDTLRGVRPERGGYIDGAWNVSHWYWETPRIGMMFQDNGTMNGHSTPDQDEATNEALLHEPESNKCALPSAPPPQKAVVFCPLPGQVRHLKWWLTKFFADHLHIFYMYAEMDNDERTEMQLKFQDSSNPSVFVTTPKVGGTGLNVTAANHAVITQKFWVLNEQRQAFERVV
jgi:hypothetical protein